MLNVTHSDKVDQSKVCRLIDDVNLFLSRVGHDLSQVLEYSPRVKQIGSVINFNREAIETSALQPKIYALFGLHMMVMLERQAEKSPTAKQILQNIAEQTSEQALRMMTLAESTEGDAPACNKCGHALAIPDFDAVAQYDSFEKSINRDYTLNSKCDNCGHYCRVYRTIDFKYGVLPNGA